MSVRRVGLVCEGDASVSETAFSGTAKRMFAALRDKGDDVFAVDASLRGWRRAAAAVASFSPDRQRWRSKFRYGPDVAHHRTACAEQALGQRPVDVLLQIGASYDPPRADSVPCAIYSDWNIALDLEEARRTGVSRGLGRQELEATNQLHARRYKNAAVIFTISERLRQSFIDLYGIAPERVMTAYAGPNFDMGRIEEALQEPKPAGPPALLFIAKEFRRKGGDLVAEAFHALKKKLPEARLIFAGAAELPKEFAGMENVEHLGLLDKNVPSELKRLLSAYRRADVLLLPSRSDPFPTVIREAMFFGVPCVASDIWAMPEMIADGETGYLVPSGDAAALAERVERLLSDEPLRMQMGRAARARAERMFAWPQVGEVLHRGLEAATKR